MASGGGQIKLLAENCQVGSHGEVRDENSAVFNRLDIVGIVVCEGAILAPSDGPSWPGKLLQGDAWLLDAPTRRLTGTAAVQARIGNTLALIPLGGRQVETAIYLLPDGTVLRGTNSPDDGSAPEFTNLAPQAPEKWWLRDDDGKLCISGGDAGVRKPDFCSAVSLVGDIAVLKDGPHRDSLFGQLWQGDAYRLSPAISGLVRKMEENLVGNTLALEIPSGETVFYFQAGGTGRMQRGSGPSRSHTNSFRWLFRTDGSLCTARGNAEFRESDCSTISFNGQGVTLKGTNGATISGKVLKGNARNL